MSIRSIKSMSFTALVLVALCGPASYFATAYVHDPASSHSLLWSLSWSFSGAGVLVSAVTVIWCLSENYGDREVIGWLFGMLALETGAILFFLGIFGGIGCSGVTIPGTTKTMFDAGRYMSFFIGALAGLGFGFFGLLAIHANESWLGEEAAPVRKLRDVA